MGALRHCFTVIRRGLGHALELWGVTQILQSYELFASINREIETHALAFALITLVATALYELWQIATNPDLSAACRDDSPMLPFDKDEK